MVKITIEHKSPFVAKQWLDWLVADINLTMKERDVAEANRSTDFLNKQIELTNVADIRAILYKLVEEQAKTIMLLRCGMNMCLKQSTQPLFPKKRPSQSVH